MIKLNIFKKIVKYGKINKEVINLANNFVHLNVHTEYSLLNNYNPIGKLIDKAKELEFKAMAITDYNNMYGVIDFYKRCKKNGIKPIIGCELTLSYPNNEFFNIILLAKNNHGYKNLYQNQAWKFFLDLKIFQILIHIL